MPGRGPWRQRQAKLFQPRTGPVFWVGLVAAVVLVMILMRQALNILGDGGDNWRQAELETAIKRFGDTAMLAHAEWFRQGRGSEVELRVGEQRRRLQLVMSDSGWPLPADFSGQMNARLCESLWLELLAGEDTEIELTAAWQPQPAGNGWQGTCNFSAAERSDSATIFSYQVHSGHLVFTGGL